MEKTIYAEGCASTGWMRSNIVHLTSWLFTTRLVAAHRAHLAIILCVFTSIIRGVFAGILGDVFLGVLVISILN